MNHSSVLLLGKALLIAGAMGALGLTQASRSEAAAPAGSNPAPVIASAPGWVDVEGGMLHLAARTDGVVQKLMVRAGDHVKAGALLVQLDATAVDFERDSAKLDALRAQQQLEALQGELIQHRSDIARLRPLVEQQAEPAESLRQIQAQNLALAQQIRIARTAVAAARLHEKATAARLTQLQVHAPADGEILRVQAHAGEAVTTGAPLLLFAGEGPLLVRAELDERLFGLVQPGMTAEVSPEYDEARVLPARVIRLAHVVGPVQGLPDVRATAQDDRVVECVLALESRDLLIGQRVIVRIRAAR